MHRTTIAKYTKFSAEELQKSTADPLSCVAAVQLNEILSLRPRDCEHIVKGVKRCVTDKIGRYHAKLNGIVLGYAKIRVDNAPSALRLDSPYLHVRTTIDYYVFQPRIGSTLRGTVNYVSKNFVSAVIYRVFNVTVKLGQQTARLHALKNGSDISFTVNSCDMKSELPVIEGELVLNGVIPVRIKTEPGEQNGDCDEVEENAMETDTGVKQEPKTPKKKASKKSKEVPEAVSRAAAPPATNGVTAGMPVMDDSSSSESENDERSLLIKSLLGEMFGDEFTESTKSSKKDKKKKDKKEKKEKKSHLRNRLMDRWKRCESSRKCYRPTTTNLPPWWSSSPPPAPKARPSRRRTVRMVSASMVVRQLRLHPMRPMVKRRRRRRRRKSAKSGSILTIR